MIKSDWMRGLRARLARRAGKAPAMAAMLEALEPRRVLADIAWDGDAGDNLWHTAANWSTNTVPTIVDNVTINVAGTPAIILNSTTGSRSVNRLETSENLTLLTGATLTVATTADVLSGAQVTLQAGGLSGGQWDISGGALRVTSSGGTLTDVELIGELLLDTTSARVKLEGTTTFAAARLTGNAVALQLAPGYTLLNDVLVEGATVGTRSITFAFGGAGSGVIDAGAEIRVLAGAGGGLTIGDSSAATVINQGLISNESNQTITINATTFHNEGDLVATAGTINRNTGTTTSTGAITATNATLSFGGDWSIAGTVDITNSTLNLGGTFSQFNFAGFTRVGGEVNITGAYNNPGTFALNAGTGTWALRGGTISGGSITFANGARLLLTSSGGTLLNVSVAGDLLLDTTSARVKVEGTTSFATARLSGNSVSLQVAPGYTIQSDVVVEGATTGGRTLLFAFGGPGLGTIAASANIRVLAGAGGGLTISDNSAATVTNRGRISNESSQTITISLNTFHNEGDLVATAGTINRGTGTTTSTGAITATDATFSIAGDWSIAGTVAITNSTLNLGGTFSQFNFAGFTRVGGEVNITGRYNSPGTFALNAGTGTWALRGGTISGGSITFVNGARLLLTSSGGTLLNVSVAGELLLDTTSARVKVEGATTFMMARLSGNASNLLVAPGYELVNPVVVEGPSPGTRTINFAFGGTGIGIIRPSASIRVLAGAGGGLNISDNSAGTVINQGLISNESTQTILINPSEFHNEADLIATSGTINRNTGTTTSTGEIVITDATFSIAGEWDIDGTLAITNSTLNLGGTFSQFNFAGFTRVGGEVNITGRYNNPGTLAISAGTGSWTLRGGTISGRSITYANGERLLLTSGGGTLLNVTVAGELLLDTASARVRLEGSTTFTIARLSGNSSGLQVAPGYELVNPVVVEGASPGTRTILFAFGGAGTGTIGPTASIRVLAGAGAGLTINNSSLVTLTNRGLISNEASGATLSIQVPEFKNLGTVRATAGVVSIIEPGWANDGGLEADTGGVLRFGAGLTLLPTSVVQLGQAGATSALQGRVEVVGVANLGGTLDVRYTGGYVPPEGTFHNLITATGLNAAVVGDFATRLTPTAPAGDKTVLLFTATSVRLLSTDFADFNDDGVLDIFDFLEFQNLWASNDPRADLDTSTGIGVFDIFDFLAFQNLFSDG